jgi:tRNA-dihydrouridine synthase
MIHAYNFVESNGETFRNNHLDVYPHSLVRKILVGNADRGEIVVTKPQVNALKGLSENDVDAARRRILKALDEAGQNILGPMKPTVVQIAAHDPNIAAEAAFKILEMSGSSYNGKEVNPVAAIDLNLGCPQAIARKGKYGAFLHDEYPESAYTVLQKLRSALPPDVGVSAKIRLPPTIADAEAGKLGPKADTPPSPEERIQQLIDCGVDLITVHGRTRFQNKVAVGAADWSIIRSCAEKAREYSGDDNYPLFANGGIEYFNDVQHCLRTTCASGVMSSESLLENPGLFKDLDEMLGNESHNSNARYLLERQLGYADMYLDYATVFPPLPGSLGAQGGTFNVIRSHLFKFLHRYFEENADLRWSLGDNAFNSIKEARELVSEIRSRYKNMNDEQLMLRSSSDVKSSWYRRHRNPNLSASKSSDSDDIGLTLSNEEKKQLAKDRIKKLREQRLQKEAVLKL